jgi:small subunit ribosomal protein S6
MPHENRIKPYEGLFLFPQSALADLQSAVEHVETILSRAGAEIIAFSKWDERKLAYDIAGNKRGVYLLVYFLVDTSKMAGIERDCNLSERILRTLIIRADHMTEEQMRATDARQKLEDEIKLRATQPAAAFQQDEPAEERAEEEEEDEMETAEV